MGFIFDELSGKVIAAAVAVHKSLGPGFLESVYEQALKIELTKNCIPFESQKQIDVKYEDVVVGVHILDLMVDNSLIVELKSVKALEEVHYAQVRSYLRATNIGIGLLMNFNSPTLTIKRIMN